MESEKEEFPFYFEIMPIDRNKVIVVTTAVTVFGIVYLYYQWKNEEERRKLNSGRKQKNLLQNTHGSVNENYRESLKEMKLRAMQDEEEENLRFQQFMAEKNKRNKEKSMSWKEIEEEDARNMLQKSKENEERLQKLRNQKRMDQLVKDKIASFELEQLKNQGRSHLEELRSETRRSQEVHLRNAAELDNQFQSNQKNLEKEAAGRRHESLLNDEKAKERRRELQQQLERDLEELRRKSEQRKREMNAQLLEIQNNLRMHLWNEAIERNWTNRLNSLRSSIEEVRNTYYQLKNYSNQDKTMVLAAIENQKSMMKNERNEMEKMYNETGKQFLLDIRDAVEEVVSECDRLIYVWKNEPSNTHRIEECFTALSRFTMAIPTLAELKQRYRESMHTNN
ncbi:unnamed protein product [Caenorhabditis brenneri]